MMDPAVNACQGVRLFTAYLISQGRYTDGVDEVIIKFSK